MRSIVARATGSHRTASSKLLRKPKRGRPKEQIRMPPGGGSTQIGTVGTHPADIRSRRHSRIVPPGVNQPTSTRLLCTIAAKAHGQLLYPIIGVERDCLCGHMQSPSLQRSHKRDDTPTTITGSAFSLLLRPLSSVDSRERWCTCMCACMFVCNVQYVRACIASDRLLTAALLCGCGAGAGFLGLLGPSQPPINDRSRR